MRNTDTLIVGLSSSWQRVVPLGSLTPGQLIRSQAPQSFAAGKGIYCARSLQNLGGNPALASFFGGLNGDLIKANLNEIKIPFIATETTATNRICTTLMESSGRATEIIEPLGEVTHSESVALSNQIESVIPNFSQIAVCGSFPPGLPDVFFDCLDNRLAGAKIYIDVSDGLEPLLYKGPHLLKINSEEAQNFTGQADPLKAWYFLKNQFPLLGVLVITNGSDPVYAFTAHESYKVEFNKIASGNPIGAGDTFMSSFIFQDGEGASLKDNLKFSTAVASARLRVDQPWQITPELISQEQSSVLVTQLS
jgi:fructose-1-phosphate kinase PfkB-like protein